MIAWLVGWRRIVLVVVVGFVAATTSTRSLRIDGLNFGERFSQSGWVDLRNNPCLATVVIQVHGNRLETLPPSMKLLTALQRLWISNNRLTVSE